MHVLCQCIVKYNIVYSTKTCKKKFLSYKDGLGSGWIQSVVKNLEGTMKFI